MYFEFRLYWPQFGNKHLEKQWRTQGVAANLLKKQMHWEKIMNDPFRGALPAHFLFSERDAR